MPAVAVFCDRHSLVADDRHKGSVAKIEGRIAGQFFNDNADHFIDPFAVLFCNGCGHELRINSGLQNPFWIAV